MLISKQSGIVNTDSFDEVYSGELFDVYLNGVLFCRGMYEGQESISYICNHIENYSVIPFNELYGSYTVIIDYKGEKQVVFSDNSCMHAFFVSENYVGSNFKEIIQKEGLKNFDDIGCCECLALIRGGFSERTVIKGLKYSSNLKYFEIFNGRRSERSKGINSIDGESSIADPICFFRDVAHAFDKRKVICALTGGFDSRAVASSINLFKKTDCFISGDNDDSSEIILAKQVAKAGGYTLKQIRPEYPKIGAATLWKFWVKSAGFNANISTSGFRISHFMNVLQSEEYEVLLDGNAGDMHKEFWFSQEFPFYNRRKSNARLFYISRMKKYLPVFGDRIKSSIKAMEKLELKEMNRLTANINSKSCLLYGWYSDWCRIENSSTEENHPFIYSPLREIEMVRFSYNTAPHDMYLNMILRKIISKANLEVARIKTIYGTTASTETRYIVRDIFAQFKRYLMQSIRYIIRKLTGRSVFLPKVETISIDSYIKENTDVRDAVEWAKDHGYLQVRAGIGQIPMKVISDILNLYYIDKYIFGVTNEGIDNCSSNS